MESIPREFVEKHPVVAFAIAHPIITFLIVDEIACHVYNAYNHTVQLKYRENMYANNRRKGIIGNLVESAKGSIKKSDSKPENENNETEN